MINRSRVADELTDSFINYQWRLDHPMPDANESVESLLDHYRSNWLFRNKVDQLVSHVMNVINKHEE